uniref:NADH:ubiquinone reductase (H(+)-translocating) n=1 Tax=Tetranychus ludeni TaxID=182134 RepID=A0A075X903_TETLU|nr:NADH dehydrogenase subunit 5 [Tetranychus ludeni]AIH15663.1 NADH dehydrogenase subunit 5 [Tetranychus ludeni]
MSLINSFKMLLILTITLTLMNLNYIFLMNFQMVIMLNEMFLNMTKNLMFVFDMYSLAFFSIISIVVFNVLSFMNIYMNKNKKINVFFFMTKMFIMSMFLLVFSFNLWSMIIGWEGLGMSSFYLIFYYNNFESWKSGVKTFLNNKMGDSMLLLSMTFMVVNMNLYKYISLIFLFSMLTKSAQYPFMSWLPMAMAAPTPISAMVHSSTLVTAGLFIIFRVINNFLMKINLNTITNLCLMSMFFSGMKAVMEKDMKKLIALSTLSQISLIFFFMISNIKLLAFIYMCNHALFKSLMFINMGYMMMKNFSDQLKFNMTNLSMNHINMISFKISCFNLMNMSFFSSFFIKEKLMMNMYTTMFSMMKFLIFLMNSFFTMNYSLKMIFFFNKMNFKKKISNNFLIMKYNFSFILMNIFSLMFSKMLIKIMLFNDMLNLTIILFYLLTLIFNFKIYCYNFFFVNTMMNLNFMIYIYPMSFMNNNLEYSELWMEKFSLNFYFLMKNKMLIKSFNMNFNLIMMMLFMFMII